ncbi:MAG TPA: hypothetical protein VM555_06525 [Tahibacter sp.]|nr:hypothetical protein [Tahibacter sp.]
MAYKIVLVGASPAEETEFRNLVGAAASRLRQRWDIGTEADADLVVVDVDSVFGHMAWLKASASGRRTAAFTARDSARESDLLLPRPLSLDGVAGVLAMYTLEVGTANAGYANTYEPPAEPAPAPAPAPREPERPAARPVSELIRPAAPPRPPAPAPAPPPPAPVVVPPRELTLVDFLTSTPLAGPSRLVTPDAPDIVLEPATQTWYSTATGLRALAPHCSRTLKVSDWQELSPAQLAEAKSAAAQPYSRLLWFYTVNRSKGELLPGLDRGARFKLAKYPQSEREFAKHFRIATFMMKDYATLDDISAASGAPLGDVVDYVNAYYAIGFVESDKPRFGEMADAKGGVLSRLRNPFGR